MIRRAFLLGTTALALAACNPTTTTTTTTVSSWAQYAAAFADGLVTVGPQLGTISGLPADKVQLAVTALQQASAFAKQLAGITDPAAATPVVLQVEQALNSALAVLGPFMGLLPPPIPEVVSAAQILLPFIEAAINPSIVPKAPASVKAKAASPSAVQQSYLILLGAAQKANAKR